MWDKCQAIIHEDDMDKIKWDCEVWVGILFNFKMDCKEPHCKKVQAQNATIGYTQRPICGALLISLICYKCKKGCIFIQYNPTPFH